MRTSPALRRWYQSSLPSRSLLRLTGPDSGTFLQGLVTNSLLPLTTSNRPVYAAILNAPGRVLFDTFFYPLTPPVSPPPSDGSSALGGSVQHVAGDLLPTDYIMEFETDLGRQLLEFLDTYVLRSRVRYRIEKSLQVRVVWNSSSSPSTFPSPLPEDFQPDPRLTALGFRGCFLSSDPPLPENDFKPSTPLAYAFHRILNGVPEGPIDIQPGVALPLEAGIGDLFGVDYKKGCYVGQELTARTHYRGLVRKRFAPVRIFKEGEPEPKNLLDDLEEEEWESISEDAPLRHLNLTPLISTVKNPRPTGRLLTVLKTRMRNGTGTARIGLALVRTDDEHGGDGVVVAVRGEKGEVEWLVKSWRRDWWKDGTSESVN